MTQALSSKTFRITAGLAAFVAVCALFAWKALQPKINMASLEEVRAAVPKELLVEAPVDAAAQDRYLRLLELLKTLDRNSVDKVLDPTYTPTRRSGFPGGPPSPSSPAPTISSAEQYAAALRVWQAKPRLMSQVTEILNQGALQIPAGKPETMSFGEHQAVRTFVKFMTATAQFAVDSGDLAGATKYLLLAEKLDDRMMAANGSLLDYLVAEACESMAMRVLRTAGQNPHFPIEDCRRVLAALLPAPKTDEYAASALRAEFQRISLKLVTTDPRDTAKINAIFGSPGSTSTDEEPLSGNFDSKETAIKMGVATMACIKNLRSPMARYDRSSDAEIERVDKQLPDLEAASKLDGFEAWWGKLKYRFLMDNIHNSTGRKYLAMQLIGDSLVQTSCRCRAVRDEIRVLLASRLYRAAHGGTAPATMEGFLPLLGEWPQDPYTGKQLIYRQSSELVYAVGEDLVDNGGDIGVVPGQGKDLGISLKLIVRTPVPKKLRPVRSDDD